VASQDSDPNDSGAGGEAAGSGPSLPGGDLSPKPPSPAPAGDIELVNALAAGREGARQVLFDSHARIVDTIAHHWARRLAPRGEVASVLAEDIAQTIWLKILDALHRRAWTPSGPLAHWVARLAHTASIDFCRAYIRKGKAASYDAVEAVRLRPRDPRPGPDLLAEEREQNQRLWEAVRQLRPAFRDVIILHYYEDLPVARVGQILGISVGCVKTRLLRARLELLELLGDAGGAR
jgi:RNA polymerase sigma-70 factor (ECF subfamily)